MGLKIDLKKEQKHLYAPSAKDLALVEVPAMDFFMADGAGDPNTSTDFQAAVEALYSLSYALGKAWQRVCPPRFCTSGLLRKNIRLSKESMLSLGTTATGWPASITRFT